MGQILALFNPSLEDIEREEREAEEKESLETKEEEEEEILISDEQQLLYQVGVGDEAKIKELLDRDVDVNCHDKWSVTDNINISKEDRKKQKEDREKLSYITQKVYEPITLDTPMHIAAEANLPNICKTLFFNRATVNAKNRIGSTPLHRAVSKAAMECIVELIDNIGCDLHAKNTIGNTPLHVACAMGNTKVIALLLEKGAAADLHVKNKCFMTPIEYCPKFSPERDMLLSHDDTLHQYLSDEEEEYEEKEEKKSR